MEFEPKILGFLCNWCSYAGADLAGVSRIQYPPNIRIVRVMCSGRIEPYFVFEALQNGIDGVILMGCHPGECHYVSGNLEAQSKFFLIQKLLQIVKLDNRIQLEWVSASEGARFGKVVTDFTKYIKNLGPSPAKNLLPENPLFQDLQALKNVADDYRLRALIGRKRTLIEEGNVYNQKIDEDEFEVLFDKAITDEFYQQKIYQLLKQQAYSVRLVASQLNISKSKTMEYMITLKKKGLVDLSHIQELSPFYIAMEEVSE